eukprot:Gb_22805 [translate_table: standard]
MKYYTFHTLLEPLAAIFEHHNPKYIFRSCNFRFIWDSFAGYHSGGVSTIQNYKQLQPKEGSYGVIGHVNSLFKDGLLHEALDSWILMDKQGVPTDSQTYIRLLQGCITKKALGEGKRLHAHMVQTGFKAGIFLCNNLINMYAKCGSLGNARQLFDKISDRDMISWNALISGYAQHGYYEEVLKNYYQMQNECMKPDRFTFASVLSTCANLVDLEKGKQVHTHIIRTGFESQVFVGNALVDMYAKCGMIEAAHHLFREIPEKDEVSWNALITGYVQNGLGEETLKLLCQMQGAGLKASHFTFGSVLKACGSVSAEEQGKQVHACIIKTGFESNVFMGSAIVDMYAKCGRLQDAQQAFDKLPEQEEVSWNALITGYVQNGYGEKTLKLFCQMQRVGLKTNHFTFGSVLKACGSLAAQEQGKQVHSCVIKAGFEFDVFVGSAIVDMYAKCGCIEDARRMFHKMPKRNLVTWNTMLAGFCQSTDVELSLIYVEEALDTFCQMQREGMKPNNFTISSVLGACTYLTALEHGKQIHVLIIKNKFEIDEFVGSALVDMYAKCRAVDDACKWFEKMPKHDIVSWTTMVAGYAQCGHGEEALRLFCEVLRAGMKPDQSTFSSVLSASASIAALEQGKQVHVHTIKTGFESCVVVGNALVDMYAKCGSIDDARAKFEEMPERDMVSWTVLILGYAQHGRAKEALQLFDQMQEGGMKPNHVTFVGVLSACSHVGLVDEGCFYFDSMRKDHGITPGVEHCACIVDLFGRAGRLDEAEHFISEMQFESDAVVWRALLSACRIHGNIDMGNRAAEHILELEPQDAATYVLLSNIYAMAGKWDNATKVRNMMKGKRVKKEPGLSWIEINNTIHSFVAGDRSHPQTEIIYAKLESLWDQMKDEGYVPDRNFVLHGME